MLKALPEKNVVRKCYHLQNRPILLHTRGKSSLYNLDIILSSLKIVTLEIPDVILILTTSFDKLSSRNRKLIHSLNLINNILFAGFQNRINDLKYFYTDSDLVISVPSDDSSPFSVYESLACKTHVIVSNLPWLYSKFIPEKHFMTVPVRDSVELARRIINFLNDKKKFKIDIEAAFQLVYDTINLKVENSKLEKLYFRILR